MQDDVLHFGRDAKNDVQRQLHHQAEETRGKSVCWQPEAEYGIETLDGVIFVGGSAALLRRALDDTQ